MYMGVFGDGCCDIIGLGSIPISYLFLFFLHYMEF